MPDNKVIKKATLRFPILHTFIKPTTSNFPHKKAVFDRVDRANIQHCLSLKDGQKSSVNFFNPSMQTPEADFVLTGVVHPV